MVLSTLKGNGSEFVVLICLEFSGVGCSVVGFFWLVISGSVIWEKESGTPNSGSEVDVPRSATKIGGSSEGQEGGIGR